MNVYSVIKSLFKLSTYSESLNFRVMLFSRHLIFASLNFRDFFSNREIREINMSRKFHVIR